MISTRRTLVIWACLGAIAAAALALATAVGSVPLGGEGWWEALMGRGNPAHITVIHELRLPRALTAFATGALLAMAGVLMQVLLRNPLADPYILGLSGGAATATLGAMWIGLAGLALPLAGFAGALLSALLVFGLAHGRGAWTPTRLLLTGVVVAAGWGALIALLLALAPERNLRGMLFWLMGDLSDARSPLLPLATAGVMLGACLMLARRLNIMARGERAATLLGENVQGLRIAVYILSALATAVVVSVAGSIGFVGLVVPHMMRLIGGSDHRVLLPSACLAGGCLVLLADTLARTVAAPQQLPVGVVTAALGVPLFLWLLNRGGGRP